MKEKRVGAKATIVLKFKTKIVLNSRRWMAKWEFTAGKEGDRKCTKRNYQQKSRR